MENSKVIVPPIKCQGIKTKIVPFIKEKVERNTDGVWIEPFVEQALWLLTWLRKSHSLR